MSSFRIPRICCFKCAYFKRHVSSSGHLRSKCLKDDLFPCVRQPHENNCGGNCTGKNCRQFRSIKVWKEATSTPTCEHSWQPVGIHGNAVIMWCPMCGGLTYERDGVAGWTIWDISRSGKVKIPERG